MSSHPNPERRGLPAAGPSSHVWRRNMKNKCTCRFIFGLKLTEGVLGRVYRYTRYLWWACRTHRTVRYRCQLRTEPYRSVRKGNEAVPNLTEAFGRGYLWGKYSGGMLWYGLFTLKNTPLTKAFLYKYGSAEEPVERTLPHTRLKNLSPI